MGRKRIHPIVERTPVVPKEKEFTNKVKFGKGFTLPEVEGITFNVYVPNVFRYKSIQIDFGAWIQIDPEIEDHDINRIVNLTVRNLRNYVEQLAKKYPFFYSKCIVDLDTTRKQRLETQSRPQFLNLDITLFVKDIQYDRDQMEPIMKKVSEDIVYDILVDEQVFNFIKKAPREYDILRKNK